MNRKSVSELFSDVPEELKLKRPLNIPEAMSELELEKHMKELASKNANTDEYICFLGAGAYDHYIPSVIRHMLMRGEFYTAYTPYQPEISQGTLQAIFEYQTMICELTGMDVANASMYDGASAAAEAVLLACGHKRKNKVLTASNIHPEYTDVIRTYTKYHGISVEQVAYSNGVIDLSDLEKKIDTETAAFVVQNPNFFGAIENLDEISRIVKNSGALFIVIADPISLAILKPPSEYGADVVVGEGQSLGNSLSFGGPYLGFFAATNDLLRKMPGRIVGQTTDVHGNRGFVLTMQTREQHIRREKATSNICTNQALNALAATIYLTLMGKKGLKEVASLCVKKAHYAYRKLIETGKFVPAYSAPFFKEFAVKLNSVNSGKSSGNGGLFTLKELNKKLLKEKIIGGYELGRNFPDMDDAWLIAITEKRTRDEIDKLVELSNMEG